MKDKAGDSKVHDPEAQDGQFGRPSQRLAFKAVAACTAAYAAYTLALAAASTLGCSKDLWAIDALAAHSPAFKSREEVEQLYMYVQIIFSASMICKS